MYQKQDQETRDALRAERIQEATEKALSMLASAELPKRVAYSFLRTQAGCGKPSDTWSLGNRLIMWASGTDDARGFHDWKEVGRSVVKGAKAFYILAPIMASKVVRQEDGTETKEHFPVGFTTVPVFRFEDTDGADLPQPEDLTPDALPPMYDVARAWGIDVSWVGLRPGQDSSAYGWYDILRDSITLLTAEWSVFWHELGHAAHKRVDGKLKGGQDPYQEIVAELTAATLATMHGQEESLGCSRRYIEAYARSDISQEQKPQVVMRAIGTVQKCLDLMLKTAEDLASDRSAQVPA